MDEERTLVAHLEDLRGVVLSSISVFGFCFVAFLLSIQHTIPLITQGRQLVMLSPLDVVRFYASVAGGLSLGVSAPFVGYRLWRFVRPALTAQESRAALTYIPAMFFSFVLGIAFGFFVVFPFAYRFLTGLGESHFTVMVTTQEYMSFLLMTTLPMGFLFEVPFVLMFLTATRDGDTGQAQGSSQVRLLAVRCRLGHCHPARICFPTPRAVPAVCPVRTGAGADALGVPQTAAGGRGCFEKRRSAGR